MPNQFPFNDFGYGIFIGWMLALVVLKLAGVGDCP